MNKFYKKDRKVTFYHFAKEATLLTNEFIKWYGRLNNKMQDTIQFFLKEMMLAVPCWSVVAFFKKVSTSHTKEELDEILERNIILRNFLDKNVKHLKSVLKAWENSTDSNIKFQNAGASINDANLNFKNQTLSLTSKNSVRLFRVKAYADLNDLTSVDIILDNKMALQG